jgi:hypothetical protein
MSKNKLVAIVRWLARIWGFFLLVVAILETFPDPHALPNIPWQEYISPVFLFGGAVLGWLVAWRWESLGGSLMILGWLFSMIAARLYRGEWLPGNVIVLTAVIFALPGFLFLWCWWSSRKND